MKHILALMISACLALGGGGVGVAGLGYATRSPRLLTAGIVAAAIGIGLGAFLLDRVLDRAGKTRAGSVLQRGRDVA